MGRRFKKKSSFQERNDGDGVDESAEMERKSGLSLKDAGVILIMSTILSMGLVTGTIGVNGILEKLHRNDITDLMLALFFFVCLFALLSYALVKVAAHYLVYLAIATCCGIIFPVSPRKQRKTVSDIYEKARK